MWYFQSQDIKFPMWESWNQFLPNKTSGRDNSKPPKVKTFHPDLWRHVKHKICRQRWAPRTNCIRKHLKNHVKKTLLWDFCKAKSTNCRVVYVKPYHEMSQAFKQHKHLFTTLPTNFDPQSKLSFNLTSSTSSFTSSPVTSHVICFVEKSRH